MKNIKRLQLDYFMIEGKKLKTLFLKSKKIKKSHYLPLLHCEKKKKSQKEKGEEILKEGKMAFVILAGRGC